MYLLVVYDIVSDKRRYQVDKILSSYGNRVNYSVFEMELGNSAKSTMLSQLKSVIDESEDSLRLYPIDRVSATKAQEIGNGTEPFTQESGSVF